MLTQVQISSYCEAASPMLVWVNSIHNTFPKTIYTVYYQLAYNNNFRNLNSLKELFLSHQSLTLKVINFEDSDAAPILLKSKDCKLKKNQIVIRAEHEKGKVEISGIVLNQNEKKGMVIDISLLENNHYEDFHKFRKKYKTLENITKRIEFKLDHRIRITYQSKEYFFSLDQFGINSKSQHYFLDHHQNSGKSEITFFLEELNSIEDYLETEIISEEVVDLSQIYSSSESYTVSLKFLNQFSLVFLLDLVKNQNLAASDFVALRVFECSQPNACIKIGTEKSLHLSGCLKIDAVLDKKYFDLEYGYLNKNLEEMGGEKGKQSIYEYMDKLTKSFPNYPNFINQSIIDFRGCTTLLFQFSGQLIKIPLAYIINGLNIFHNSQGWIKFYVESDSNESDEKGEDVECFDYKSDKRRVYEMSITDICNLGEVNGMLDEFHSEDFLIKVINQSTIYSIPFTRKTVNASDFKKEAKSLELHKSYSEFSSNNFFTICKHPTNHQKLILLASTGIHPFYILEMTSSSSISFQIAVRGSIVLEGSLTKRKIIESKANKIRHMVGSVDGQIKVSFSLSFAEVKQINESVSTFYQFRHKLFFAEASESDDSVYDIEIIKIQKQEANHKLRKKQKLKAKINAELKKEDESSSLKQFEDVAGFFSKEDELQFRLVIRKMCYNEELNQFDNGILSEKLIIINPEGIKLSQPNTLFIRLEKQCYQGFELDLYDEVIKKRLKYQVEVFAKKSEFFDAKDSSYKVKIPNVLWQMNNNYSKSGNEDTYEIRTHLNRKKKSSDQINLRNLSVEEVVVDHYNYNDGISISLNNGSKIGYCKIMDTMKIRCDIVKDKIGWASESDWHFCTIHLQQSNFYFLLQRLFDPYENKKKDSSQESKKTITRSRSNRSDKHKIDPLAKTINNFDLFKLKKIKNDLVSQGRQLTARYVQKQEKILKLNKKIIVMNDTLKQRVREESEAKIINDVPSKKPSKEAAKMKELYRAICQCGARNPQFNGFCGDCLSKLKKRYEAYLKQYKEKTYEYEKYMFDKYNRKQKIDKLKKRIYNFKHNIKEDEDGKEQDNSERIIKELEEKNLRRVIEELKMSLFEVSEERVSLVETSNWQQTKLEAKIREEDEKIYALSQQYEGLKSKLNQLKSLS